MCHLELKSKNESIIYFEIVYNNFMSSDLRHTCVLGLIQSIERMYVIK